MKTEIIKIEKDNIDIQKIKYAADVLKHRGVVAFPTETVYGLGANALNENAVKKIFEAKGRPGDNPLIVHVAHKASVESLVEEIPLIALNMMDEFWPGPLTIILKKSSNVPEIITAGLDTVAIRIPKHPIALKLIEEANLPIAAPSANISGRPSPTDSSHVIEDLYGRVDLIIDGGNSKIGLESTVLDLTQTPPMILRPGGIDIHMISKFITAVDFDPAILEKNNGGYVPKSPGMKYKHYSPLAQVIVIEGETYKVVDKIGEMLKSYSSKGIKVGVLASDQTKGKYNCKNIISLGNREKPETIANKLFGAMRDFDKIGVSVILAEAVECEGIGVAIMNRMSKAAGFNIIRV